MTDMKKFAIFTLLVSVLFVCGCSEKEDAPIVRYVNSVVEEYPNYRSNEISEKSLKAKFENREKSVYDLVGVHFKFKKLIENTQTGKHSALFESTGCTSSVESNADGGKYIINGICILVLGTVDDSTASKLNSGVDYELSGTLHAWDKEDRFYCYDAMIDGFFLGTYILDCMTVKEIKQ